MKKISIIVPIYNVEKYLENCVESLIRQTYRNIEIILVNDGSTDSSGKICDDYLGKDDRIKVFHKKNGGLSDARNYGLKKATGSLVSFVDSDDIVAENFIELLYKGIEEKDADIVIANSCNVNEDEKSIVSGDTGEYELVGIQDALEKMYYDSDNYLITFVTAWAKLVKRHIAEKALFPVGKTHEDEFTTYKWYLDAKKIVFINTAIYGYRLRENSIMTSSYSPKRLDAIEAFEERIQILENENYKEIMSRTYSKYFYLLEYNILELYKNNYIEKYKIYKNKYYKEKTKHIKRIDLLGKVKYIGRICKFNLKILKAKILKKIK